MWQTGVRYMRGYLAKESHPGKRKCLRLPNEHTGPELGRVFEKNVAQLFLGLFSLVTTPI